MISLGGMNEPSVFKAVHYHGIEYRSPGEDRIYILASGIQRCLPGYAYGSDPRKGYHLHAVLSGRGSLRAGGKAFDIHAGQLFLVKHMEETFYQADREDPWLYVWVTFSGDDAGKYMEYAGFGDGVYVRDSAVDIMEFYHVVKEIVERPHLDVSSEIYRKSLALRYLSLAIESNEKLNEKSARANLGEVDYVDYATRYIRSNYAHTNVGDVARYIGISRSHFASIFKKRMYMSPQEFLMQVRMNKSKELLTRTDAPVNVVAGEVGYEDQLTFSKAFKKRFGLSPEQYRKWWSEHEH